MHYKFSKPHSWVVKPVFPYDGMSGRGCRVRLKLLESSTSCIITHVLYAILAAYFTYCSYVHRVVLFTGEGGLRLVNKWHHGQCGRLQYQLYNGTWGTICDNKFDENAASVACRQLGYRTAKAVLYEYFM